MTRKYQILNASELLELEALGFVTEAAVNRDGSLLMCEFIESPEGPFLTHEEALVILSGPDWHNPDLI